MFLARSLIDNSYNTIKNYVFSKTSNDPEQAHEKFLELANGINSCYLSDFLLKGKYDSKDLPFELSNAAGFNKNGDIPPEFLKALGFNRMVVGTVTNDKYDGNPKPRIKRYVKTGSMINWMGLPGIGSERVAENLDFYRKNIIPTTINLMSTPGKVGDELLLDLEKTINDTKDYTDRFELNISCPNTHSSGVMDARDEYQKSLSNMLDVLKRNAKDKELYVKVSPDLSLDGVIDIINVLLNYPINGITIANTTTTHSTNFISESPGKGGASGRAVRNLSIKVQNYFVKEIEKRKMNLKIIACGGIDSPEEVGRRLNDKVIGVQVYTPLIFEGPKLITNIQKKYINGSN